MIIEYPEHYPPVVELYELSNCPLDSYIYKEACEKFSKFDASSSDQNYWRFDVTNEIPLLVGVNTKSSEYGGNQISCAILSFCWWESYSKNDHENIDFYERERKKYDELFAKEFLRAVKLIGQSLLENRDMDEPAHRYAIWKGTTLLLILQQSSYDPQFGYDINYWIQPWDGSDPDPTSPFIDWLFDIQNRM